MRMSASKAASRRKKRRRNYTSRLQKGGALLEDMRLLVRAWSDDTELGQRDRVVAHNVLGKQSRARALDTLTCAFIPRFIRGLPKDAWRIVRPLEDRGIAIDILKPVYYWITARAEPILYDFACEELHRYEPQQEVPTKDVASWVAERTSREGIAWSPIVTQKVARGILATLRDFGLLDGRVKKRIAGAYLPVESFAYIAFVLQALGASAQRLVHHDDWCLFRLDRSAVERMFLESDRAGLLSYHAAGQIVRIDFPATSFEEMADVVARTAHE